MSLLQKILNVFAFIASGIITIAVGFFMLRGTMRMWDKNKEKNPKSDEGNSKKS
jgi:predicted PurR-regulated permease PerM